MPLRPTADADLLVRLDGIPPVDINENLRAALTAGRRVTNVMREAASLRYGPTKLAPQEYFYYRLWDADIPMADKRRFVGKIRQKTIHDACNVEAWRASAADKVVWHTLMASIGLPTPITVAVTKAKRILPGAKQLETAASIEAFLRGGEAYPLFAKPAAGRYSLGVLSADRYERETDAIVLTGGDRKGVSEVANLIAQGEGFLVQQRLAPGPSLAEAFGPRLWSIRLLVLLTELGSLVHRAVAKIAVGANPADNFWRPGNMLGAIDLSNGRIVRVIRGSGINQRVDELHPDTGRPLVGTAIPDWLRLLDLTRAGALVFPGIRTQSWDVALTDKGPVLLEVNYGGDLNLPQLAHGKGVLDNTYAEHLQRCGYRLR